MTNIRTGIAGILPGSGLSSVRLIRRAPIHLLLQNTRPKVQTGMPKSTGLLPIRVSLGLPFHQTQFDKYYILLAVIAENRKIKEGKADEYNANYRRVLKFKILKKRKSLTEDLLLVKEVLDKLQEL